jgi:hypothetical protein
MPAAHGGAAHYPWLTQLLARRPFKVVAVALANKMARTAWALMVHGGTYRFLISLKRAQCFLCF